MLRGSLLVGRVVIMQTLLESKLGQLSIVFVKLFVQRVLQRADTVPASLSMLVALIRRRRRLGRVDDSPGIAASGTFAGAEDVQ